MRREERDRHEASLAAAREDWRRERNQLLQDAEKEKQDAILREKEVLEMTLRDEFSQTLDGVMKDHEQHVQETVRLTWAEADQVKEEAMMKAREEERHIAACEADRVAQQVMLEKKAAAREAEERQQQALKEQDGQLRRWHRQEQEKLKKTMETTFADKLSSTNLEHQKQITSLHQVLDEERTKCQQLHEELREMTKKRDAWEQKYQDLRSEFSNFIDQFPGFKAEFIL